MSPGRGTYASNWTKTLCYLGTLVSTHNANLAEVLLDRTSWQYTADFCIPHGSNGHSHNSIGHGKWHYLSNCSCLCPRMSCGDRARKIKRYLNYRRV